MPAPPAPPPGAPGPFPMPAPVQALKDAATQTNPAIAVVPETGHFTQIEAADAVNRLIAEFAMR